MSDLNDLEEELQHVARDAMLSGDVDEAARHIRQHAVRVAQSARQTTADYHQADKDYREFMAEHGPDLLDDPELMKRMQEREALYLRSQPQWSRLQRWHRSANDVRRLYGTADQRVIRGMRQERQGARLASDSESYVFDTGADEPPFEQSYDVDEQLLAADRIAAIAGIAKGKLGREVKLDVAKYNEQELRRRQRADR